MEQKAIYQMLADKLGADAVIFNDDGQEAYAEVAADKIDEAALLLRDEVQLEFNQLMCLSGIDWDGYDETGKGKSVKILGYTREGIPETSDRVGEGDLGVAYHLFSHSCHHKFTMRVRVPRDNAVVNTVNHIWATASWHEREAWDMFGIRFAGHPNLRRMLLDDTWEGHPLRKDYVMPNQWEAAPLEGKALNVNPFAKPATSTADIATADIASETTSAEEKNGD